MAQEKETISTVKSLIETLKDGQEGFKQAAEGVKDLQLKSLFNEYPGSVPASEASSKARRKVWVK